MGLGGGIIGGILGGMFGGWWGAAIGAWIGASIGDSDTDCSHDGGIHLYHHIRQPRGNRAERQEEHPVLLPVGGREHRLARL